jgi:hypothetical protein
MPMQANRFARKIGLMDSSYVAVVTLFMRQRFAAVYSILEHPYHYERIKQAPQVSLKRPKTNKSISCFP